MITGKVWGTTEALLKTPLFELHRLCVKPNSRCSIHRHKFKWNGFFVQAGHLTIEVERPDGLVDRTTLSSGDFTTVRPGEYHRFVSRDGPVHLLEIYYLEPLSEDIDRRDVGGSDSSTFQPAEEEGAALWQAAK